MNFFVALDCHELVLDGFNQLLSFFALPLSKQCRFNKSQQHRIFRQKNSGNDKNWTRDGWVGSANATSVQCRPPNFKWTLSSSRIRKKRPTYFYFKAVSWLKRKVADRSNERKHLHDYRKKKRSNRNVSRLLSDFFISNPKISANCNKWRRSREGGNEIFFRYGGKTGSGK